MRTRWTGRRLPGVVATVVVSAVAAAAVGQLPTAQAADSAPVDCVAHRGGADSGATEETTGAYDYAMRHGVTMVEGDLRFSATGYPFLLHDRTLGAFGAPEVALADISGTQASTYTSPSGGRIASLTQIVGLLRGQPGAKAQLELKETPTPLEWKRLNARLRPVADRVQISSFSVRRLKAATRFGYRTAFLTDTDVDTYVAPVISQNVATLTADDVTRYTALGMRTQAWTPDSRDQWATAATDGVSDIVTDRAVDCLKWAASVTRVGS